MRTATESRISHAIGRVKEIWDELDYAQRRLLEIRTGLPFGTGRELADTLGKPPERSSTASRVDELERLYALESPELSPR